jgi:hypothetical protein
LLKYFSRKGLNPSLVNILNFWLKKLLRYFVLPGLVIYKLIKPPDPPDLCALIEKIGALLYCKFRRATEALKVIMHSMPQNRKRSI